MTWSSGAKRIKDYPAEEIVGQHFSRFYTQEDIERGVPGSELKVAVSQGQTEEDGVSEKTAHVSGQTWS